MDVEAIMKRSFPLGPDMRRAGMIERRTGRPVTWQLTGEGQLARVGADPTTTSKTTTTTEDWTYEPPTPMEQAVTLALTGALAYHGYGRNKSVGWAIGWGLLGWWFPWPVGVMALAIAYSQGFAKPAGRGK